MGLEVTQLLENSTDAQGTRLKPGCFPNNEPEPNSPMLIQSGFYRVGQRYPFDDAVHNQLLVDKALEVAKEQSTFTNFRGLDHHHKTIAGFHWASAPYIVQSTEPDDSVPDDLVFDREIA